MAAISNMIQIGQYRERKKKEKEDEAERKVDKLRAAYQDAQAADRMNHSEETAVELLAAGFGYMEAMMSTGLGEILDEAWKRREEIFRERYQKVFEAAPDMPVARIKYFCAILLELVPIMTGGSGKDRYSAYDDFFNVYMEGVDTTLSGWSSYDWEAELEYPFLQMEITKENMGPMLTEILEKIITATPEKDADAKRDFIWQLAKLFQFCRESAFALASDIGGREGTGIQNNYEVKYWMSDK